MKRIIIIYFTIKTKINMKYLYSPFIRSIEVGAGWERIQILDPNL